MSNVILFDPMFHVPFWTGLILAAALPILGMYLRLRREWLAALGYAHIAGAGGVLAPLLALPVIAGALGAGGAAAVAKGLLRRKGNDVYVVFIMLGWSGMLLAAAHGHSAQLASQAFVDGQLYFSGLPHLATAVMLGLAVMLMLPPLSRLLLREQLFPGHDRANGRPVTLQAMLFDALVALTVALAAGVMGVMAAFATLFVPAWVAFALAGSWRAGLALSTVLSVLVYLAAFAGAIVLDLPFGPLLVAALLLLAPLRLMQRS
jgi:zinc/manganese transport system permease protein